MLSLYLCCLLHLDNHDELLFICACVSVRVTVICLVTFLFAAELDHIKGSSGIGSLLMEFRERVDEVV